MQDTDNNDVDLKAFRFIAGDMSSDEAIEFERQLAEDQRLREAVSQAVAVSERLALVTHATNQGTHDRAADVTRRAKTIATALTWMAVGAIAASITFMLTGWMPSNRDTHIVEEIEPSRLTPNVTPESPIDPMLVDGLVWSQIDSTTRWESEFDWLGQPSGFESPFPRLDLPAPHLQPLQDIYQQSGEDE